MHGNLAEAVGFNALVTLGLPFLVLGVAREGLRLWRGSDPIRWRIPAWVIRILLAVLLGFMALRNLPGSPLSPG